VTVIMLSFLLPGDFGPSVRKRMVSGIWAVGRFACRACVSVTKWLLGRTQGR
jgi:hypothetical protein